MYAVSFTCFYSSRGNEALARCAKSLTARRAKPLLPRGAWEQEKLRQRADSYGVLLSSRALSM